MVRIMLDLLEEPRNLADCLRVIRQCFHLCLPNCLRALPMPIVRAEIARPVCLILRTNVEAVTLA